MKLGIGSYSLPWAVHSHALDALGLLEVAHHLGADVLQVCENLPVADWRTLRERAAACGITLEIGARGLQGLGALLECCEQTGARLLRLVLGEHVTEDDAVRALSPLADDFRRAGVALAIENHDALEVAALERTITRLGTDWAGATVDTANSLGAGEDLGTVWQALGTHARCVHVKDVCATRVPPLGLGFTVHGCALGAGILGNGVIEHTLGQLNARCQSVILEQWPPQQATLEETLKLERSWLEAGFVRLKRALGGGHESATNRGGTP